MKTQANISLLHPVLLLLLWLCPSCSSAGDNQGLSGNWQGMFMDDFPTTLSFTMEEGSLNGRVRMYDGDQQIQDDGLTKIKLEGNKLSFYIPAKETIFEGTLDEEKQKISGVFIFPDQSEHPFTAMHETDLLE